MKIGQNTQHTAWKARGMGAGEATVNRAQLGYLVRALCLEWAPEKRPRTLAPESGMNIWPSCLHFLWQIKRDLVVMIHHDLNSNPVWHRHCRKGSK